MGQNVSADSELLTLWEREMWAIREKELKDFYCPSQCPHPLVAQGAD